MKVHTVRGGKDIPEKENDRMKVLDVRILGTWKFELSWKL